MKRYIYSSTRYKDNDPRLPIIKAIEDVLGIEFKGNNPDWRKPQYSTKYDCDIDYTISSKSRSGKRIYEFSLSSIHGREDLEDTIVRDMKDYILNNFSQDLHVATYTGYPPFDKHNKLSCYEYGISEEESNRRRNQTEELDSMANSIYKQVTPILEQEGYDVKSFRPYQKYVCIFVKVRILDESVEQDAIEIKHMLQTKGFHLKSVDIQYGRIAYPSTWVDHLIRINIYYD